MSISERNAAKLERFLKALETSYVVKVHLNPVHPGTVVPKEYGRQHHLCLEFGLNLPVQINDLRTTEDGLSATLSFNRRPFSVYLPWSAVYGLEYSDGKEDRGWHWPADVPEQVSAVPVRPDSDQEITKVARRPKGERPYLKLLN